MFGRGQIEGFRYGSIQIKKIGWRRWEWMQFGSDPNGKTPGETADPTTWRSVLVHHGEFHGSEQEVRLQAHRSWKRLETLMKLQRAMEAGKISAHEMYQILEMQDRKEGPCKRRHVHSAKCSYHPHGPEDQ